MRWLWTVISIITATAESFVLSHHLPPLSFLRLRLALCFNFPTGRRDANARMSAGAGPVVYCASLRGCRRLLGAPGKAARATVRDGQ